MLRSREPVVSDDQIDAEVMPSAAAAPARAEAPVSRSEAATAEASVELSAYGGQHDVEFAVYGGTAPVRSPAAKAPAKPQEPEKPVDVVKEQVDFMDQLRKREAIEKRKWEAFFLSATSTYLKNPAKGGICRKAEYDGDLVRFLLGPEEKKLGEIIYDSRKSNISLKGPNLALDNVQAARALIEMGQSLGWTMMTFVGSKEFVEVATRLARDAGMEVVSRQTLDARLALKPAPDFKVTSSQSVQPSNGVPKPPTQSADPSPAQPRKTFPSKSAPAEEEDDYGFSPSPI